MSTGTYVFSELGDRLVITMIRRSYTNDYRAEYGLAHQCHAVLGWLSDWHYLPISTNH